MTRILTPLRVASALVAAPLLYIALSSNSGGITGVSSAGCNSGGACHGASSSSTVLTVTGIPATGWVPGTAYSVTATVTNNTKVAAGFDLTVNVGTLSGAPTGTALNGSTEIRHTSPKSMTSGATSWTFTWTAPSSGSTGLVINFAGNAVNLNSSQAGDSWNTATFNYAAAAATPTAPTATTASATGVTTNAAVVNGSVNANNGSTTVTFDYGTTTAVSLSAAATPGTVTGATATSVSANLSSLSAGTKYYYRVKAVNAAGTTNGTLDSFTTSAATNLPVISIVAPTTTNTTATVKASVSANAAATTVTLNYGLTTAVTSTGTVTGSPVAANSSATVSSALTGLQANTKYYYKFTATSSAGTATKLDSFTTSPLAVANVATAIATVYPNPASDVLQVELAATTGAAQIWVFNTAGQRMAVPVQAVSKNRYQLDVAALPAGGYWLLVQDGTTRSGKAFQKL